MAPPSGTPIFGFLNVNKPSGMTAHDVVARVRRLLRIKQVGHGGTLDPMATGVLPLAIGKATRLLRFLTGEKVYVAGIKFGLRTTTDDVEGDTIATSEVIPDRALIETALASFVGIQQQRPPNFSAVHVNGKRAYDLARAGDEVNLATREVDIRSIEALSFESPVLNARIACGTGTYIRSIARDLGEQLGSGACLSSLVREQSGPFRIERSFTLDQIAELVAAEKTNDAITSPESALTLKSLDASEQQATDILHGRVVEIAGGEVLSAESYVMVLYGEKLIAICKQTTDNMNALTRIQPEVVVT